jgi:predicted acylesterase/phospholipase RssA
VVVDMKALVGAGGGVKGAFCAGVLDGPLRSHQPDFDPSIISGTSIGSMLSFFAQAPFGQFYDYVDRYRELWLSLPGSKAVWKKTKFRMVWRLIASLFFSKKSLGFNPAVLGSRSLDPLGELLNKNLDRRLIRQTGRKLRVAAVDLVTQKLVYGREDSYSLIRWIQGSCAPPGLVSPMRIFDMLLVDAAIREIVPIMVAEKLGATDIVVLLTDPKAISASTQLSNYKTVLDVLIVSLDAMLQEIRATDFCVQSTSKITVYAPTHILVPGFGEELLDFDPKLIRSFYEEGLQAEPVSLAEFMGGSSG